MMRLGYSKCGCFEWMRVVPTMLALCVSLSVIPNLNAQSLQWFMPSGGTESWLNDVTLGLSKVAVGGYRDSTGRVKPFGVIDYAIVRVFATPDNGEGEALGITDPRLACGWAKESNGRRRPCAWRTSDGAYSFLNPPEAEGEAYESCSLGFPVYGWYRDYDGYPRAARWDNELGSPQDITPPNSPFGAKVYAASVDGTVAGGEILGDPEFAPTHGRAFIWTRYSNYYYPQMPNDIVRSWVTGISVGSLDDINTVVAVGGATSYYPLVGTVAFRWTFQGGTVFLPHLPGSRSSIALDVLGSPGNEVVVGTSGERAFVWTLSTGTKDLNAIYAHLVAGSRLVEARAIGYWPWNNPHYVIVGKGYNARTRRYEGFVLRTGCTAHNGDVNIDGCVDDADLLAVLFAFGQSGSPHFLGRVDVNCDGSVDDADLLIVLFNFGSGCCYPPC